MGIHLKRAVFLDRDGTLNPEVFYTDTKAYESPRSLEKLTLIPSVIDALLALQKAGFLLFIVSNQPNAAKGKNTMPELLAIGAKMARMLQDAGVTITESYYCYHHPDGTVAPYAGECECRKPSPYFLLQAKEKYRIDMKTSWMVGDRKTDIECGALAGVRTLRVNRESTLAESLPLMLAD